MKKIKVVLADDHAVVRMGFRLLLQDTDDIEVIGEAKNGEEAIKICAETKPNVLSLKWSFGFNKEIIGGVHNLTDQNRNALFYVAAHSGVSYLFYII